MFHSRSTAIFFGTFSNGTADCLKKSDVVHELAKTIENGPVWDDTSAPIYDHQAMSRLIKAQQVKKIILAGHSTGIYKSFLVKSLMMAGLTGDDLSILNFRD